MTVQLGIDGQEQPERVCACGHGRSLDGMRRDAIYASGPCRTRDWKRRLGYSDTRRVKPSRNGKSKPSGLQVSYRRAFDAWVDLLTGWGHPDPERLADNVLKPLLSDRQRAQLEARERTA